MLDEDGRYLEILCAERSLLYDEPSKLLGRRLHDVMPEAEERRFLGFIQQTLNSDSPQLIEYSLPTSAARRSSKAVRCLWNSLRGSAPWSG